FIDGRARMDPNFPVGLMDILWVKDEEGAYRMLKDKRGRMHLVSVPKEEKNWKLCRVEGRQTIAGGKVQVRFHDGRNLLSTAELNTGDVVRLEVPTQKILDVYRLKAGVKAIISGGSHVGQLATIERYERWNKPSPNLVYFSEGFSTVWTNVFAVGETPVVTPPEVSAF
ncbi:MAG: 30S ribosomal protein S4e, partial [Methanomassiliicoccales archaeon]